MVAPALVAFGVPVDFDLTEKQRKFQALAREFAQNEVAPLARDMDEKCFMARSLIDRMAELGFLGGVLPPEYGGRGMDTVSFALVSEEIGRACSSIRGIMSVHVGLHTMCIYDWGTEEQRRHYLPRLARAELLGCYALTEPEAGSDVASLTTRARRDGDSYVLNGYKHWISYGIQADQALVFATLDPTLRHRGITCFIVPTEAPGFHRERMEEPQLGHRASDHARITLTECRVPASNRLGSEGEGFKIAMSALDHGRLGVAAGAVGLHQACVDSCVDFARKRVQFGKPIGEFQMIQAMIADMVADLEAARLLVYRAAYRKDKGLRNTRETAIAKLFATEAAARAANNAVLLHGSYGYSNASPVERYLRDIKGHQIYEGTSHIQRIIIARDALREGGST